MRTRFLKRWERLRASYWFIPGLMALGATLLAVFAGFLDRNTSLEVIESLAWLYQGGPDGARAVLSTIAGSMITVAGLAFSVTMVALVLASSQFGPRILRNFMRDRGNQFVMGTFIATFLYCLLVLRIVRSVAESSFVPHVSVTLAVALSLASVAVLIYFIDHVATAIQAPNVVARVGADLDRAIDRAFPETDEESGTGIGSVPDLEQDGRAVTADRSGYVQLIDEVGLLERATEADVVVGCLRRPGEFAVEGTPIARIAPGGRLDDEVTRRIRSAFLYGDTRSDIQDVDFAVEQLVEIAVRALSPGINDPFTAMNCVDRLTAALARAGRRSPATPWLRDGEGTPRIRMRRPTFPALLDAALDPIREHGRSNTDVLARISEALLSLEAVVERAEGRNAILLHAQQVAATAEQGLIDEGGRRRVEALGRLVRSRLEDVAQGNETADTRAGSPDTSV